MTDPEYKDESLISLVAMGFLIVLALVAMLCLGAIFQ